MGLTDECSCNVPQCNRTWPRHPILEIDCPSCGAGEGDLCKRPSGHPASGDHGKFHNRRYYEALDEGHFGECPLDRCPESSEQSKARLNEYKRKDSSRDEGTTQTELPV